eukprot:Selendium_serpulae@DN651_c0_g1_i1.p1
MESSDPSPSSVREVLANAPSPAAPRPGHEPSPTGTDAPTRRSILSAVTSYGRGRAEQRPTIGAQYDSSYAMSPPAAPPYDKREDLLFNRRLTDPWWAVFFVVALVALVHIFTKAVWNGDPRRLYHGYNYLGELCGVDANVGSAKYLYWPVSPITSKIDPLSPICVSRCFTQRDRDLNVTVMYPLRELIPTTSPRNHHVREVKVNTTMLPSLVVPTVRVGGPYCFAQNPKQLALTAAISGIASGWMTLCRSVRSLRAGWYWILLMGCLSVGVSFIHLRVVKHITSQLKLLVMGLLLLTPLTFLVCGGALVAYGSASASGTLLGGASAEAILQTLHGRLGGLALTLGVLLVLMALVSGAGAWSMRPLVNQAVEVMGITSDCFWQVPKLGLVYPLVGTAGIGLVTVWWIVGLVFLASAGSEAPQPSLILAQPGPPLAPSALAFIAHNDEVDVPLPQLEFEASYPDTPHEKRKREEYGHPGWTPIGTAAPLTRLSAGKRKLEPQKDGRQSHGVD